MASAQVVLQAGTLLKGRYRIIAVIGKGGFACVYEAQDTLIERSVAVKVLNLLGFAHDEEASSRALARFWREAKVAASIDHPNVVTIHDMGQTEGLEQPFIVMERLVGHDLGAELSRFGPMHPRRAIPLLCRALHGLEAGHRQGIVHKDLKPANLFLHHPRTEHEDIRVVDFGIARLGDKGTTLTAGGNLVGTPQYMAPEYIQGGTVTPAVDVYQMGLVLAEVLTGLPAAPGGDHAMSCLWRHTSGELDVHPSLRSGPLGAILARATARDPAQRYTSAGAMRDALLALELAAVPVFTASAPKASPPLTPPPGAVAPRLGTPSAAPDVLPHPPTLPDVPPPASAQQRPRRLLVPLLGAAALLVVAVAAAIGVAASGDPPRPDPSPPLQAKLPPVEDLPDEPPPKEAPEPPASAASEEASGPITVHIQVEPCANAAIREGDQLLGAAPLDLTFAGADAPPRALSVRCRGFREERFTLSAEDAPHRHVTLQRTTNDAEPSTPRRSGSAADKPPVTILD